MSRTNGRFDAGPGVGDRLDHRGYHKATIPLACPHEAHGVEEARRTSSTIGGMAYRLLAEGRNVRIYTARVAASGGRNAQGTLDDDVFAAYQRSMIMDWCIEHVGGILPITAQKDMNMIEAWDDRAKQVEPDTGLSIEQALLNLLAIIHRDGGHYADSYGLEKACAEAEKIVVALMQGGY